MYWQFTLGNKNSVIIEIHLQAFLDFSNLTLLSEDEPVVSEHTITKKSKREFPLSRKG